MERNSRTLGYMQRHRNSLHWKRRGFETWSDVSVTEPQALHSVELLQFVEGSRGKTEEEFKHISLHIQSRLIESVCESATQGWTCRVAGAFSNTWKRLCELAIAQAQLCSSVRPQQYKTLRNGHGAEESSNSSVSRQKDQTFGSNITGQGCSWSCEHRTELSWSS